MVGMNNEAARMLLLTCFAEAWQQVLAMDPESTWQCTPRPVVPSEAAGADRALSAGMRLRGTLHGCIALSMPERDVAAVLGVPRERWAEDLDGKWRESVDRVAGCLPKRAADASRFAFSVEPQAEGQVSVDAVAVGSLEMRDAGGNIAMLQVGGDQELFRSLQVTEWNPHPQRGASGLEQATEAQLGRVIDVPLAVTLRFGERQMRLREVLELNTGSLVELDRQVEEPVDLLLGERVIARGEVVIVDGNYGLRVTEIVESTSISLA